MPAAAQSAQAQVPHTAPSESATSKRDLTSWWKQFKKNAKTKEDEQEQAAMVAPPSTGIFGVPLDVSIRYAHVAISQVDDNGQSYLYGYVPIIIAKCGIYLKEKATDVEGIFRLAGAERRIKELMAVFNTPERYGRGLDWSGYTVHDAANLLRRYLNQLPEPIVPLAMYARFRDPLRHHQAQAVGPMDQQLETEGDFDADTTIVVFQQLITELPPLNRQLLLYILDLLAVFSSKSEVNRMTAPNLSAIFQPGILRHPDHDLVPSEYRLSQDVVIFLIEHQDHFTSHLPGAAADEKTIQDVQTAARPPTAPSTPKTRTQQLLGRSASNASAGSDTIRRHGDVRRHASTNSRGSRQSQHTPSPATPPTSSPFVPGSKGTGVFRSNTVPSKKSPSPALSASERFSRFQSAEPSATPSPIVGAAPIAAGDPSTKSSPLVFNDSTMVEDKAQMDTVPTPSPHRSPLLKPFAASNFRSSSQDRQASVGEHLNAEGASSRASPMGTPSKERSFSSLWKQSPSDAERREERRPNKLQKRRRPGEASTPEVYPTHGHGSVPASPALVFSLGTTQATAPVEGLQVEPLTRPTMSTSNSFQSAKEQMPSPAQPSTPPMLERDQSSATLKPDQTVLKELPERHLGATEKPHDKSPARSNNSHSTDAERSSQSTVEESEAQEGGKKEKRHSRWRISMSTKKTDERTGANAVSAATPATTLGSAMDAERSTSSVASNRMGRKSYTDDSSRSASGHAPSSSDADERATSPRRGLTGWFRGKMQERQEKKEEKERAKSPSPRPLPSDPSASAHSLAAIAASEAPGASQSKLPTEGHQIQQQQPTVLMPVQEQPAEVAEQTTSVPSKVVTPPAQISTSGLATGEGIGDLGDAVTPKAPQQPEVSSMEQVEKIQERENGIVASSEEAK